MTTFSNSRVWDKVPRGNTPIWGYPNFLITQCRIGKRTSPCQSQLDSSSGFDTIPACDGQSDRRSNIQTRDDSIYRASIASSGKTDMLSSNDTCIRVRGVSSGERIDYGAVGRICEKVGFKPGVESKEDTDEEGGESIRKMK